MAETKSKLWAEAQILNDHKRIPRVEAAVLPSIPGRWCFTDGVLRMVPGKRMRFFSGQG